MKYLITLYIVFILSINLPAQDGYVFVQNDPYSTQSKINVKWFSDELYYEDGVNIYRTEKGLNNWVKLNEKPLKKEDKLPDPKIDSNLYHFAYLVNESDKKLIEEGLLSIILSVYAVKSEEFALFLGMQYDDKNIELGKAYEYKVLKLSGDNEVLLGASDAITVEKFIPIDAPGEIEIKAGRKKADFKWKHENLRFYAVNIYRSSSIETEKKIINNNPIIVNEIPDKNGNYHFPEILYTDRRLQKNITYTYQLASIDFFGNESKLSKKINVSIQDLTPPPPPKNIFAKPNGKTKSVEIFWDSSSVEDLAGYDIYRANTVDSIPVKLNEALLSASTFKFRDQNVEVGSYYYSVSQVDFAGNEAGAVTLASISDVIPPAIPKNLILQADTGKIILSWSKNTEKDILGYYIYRTVERDGEYLYNRLNKTPVQDISYTDILPKNVKNRFLYKITAVDTLKNESGKSGYTAARMPDVTPPDKPFIKDVKYEKNAIVIHWIQNIEPDLKGYDIYRSVRDTDSYEKLNFSSISNVSDRFTDRNAQPGLAYKYYLIALDSSNNRSIQSNTYIAFLPDQNDEVSEVKKLKVLIKKDNKVELFWDIAKNDDYLGAVVYRSDTSSNFKPLTGLITSPNYKDSDVIKGTTYLYKIKTYNKSGNNTESAVKQVYIKE